MKGCKFCERLDLLKLGDKLEREQSKKAKDPNNPLLKNDYSVALVQLTWINGRSKQSAKKTVHFKYVGSGFDLNFCPECGRPLKRGKAIVRQGNAVLDAADKDDRRNDS